MAHTWTHREFMLEILSCNNADKDIEQEIKDLGLKSKFSIINDKSFWACFSRLPWKPPNLLGDPVTS